MAVIVMVTVTAGAPSSCHCTQWVSRPFSVPHPTHETWLSLQDMLSSGPVGGSQGCGVRAGML